MTPKLVAIKRTPIGLFDTLKIRLDHVADQDDLDALSANSTWKRKAGAQGPVFVNRENGMKVICYQDLVMVEASVPRVLGLPSDMQHLVRVVDLMEALQHDPHLAKRFTLALAQCGVLVESLDRRRRSDSAGSAS